MSTTRLQDVIVPQVYLDYQSENSPERTALFESGIIARNPLLDAQARSGGYEVTIPYWLDLDADDEPNASTDDPAVESVPSKTSTSTQRARVAYLNKSWSAMDLVGELAGSSPMQNISNRTGRYWQRQWQRRVIKSAVGIVSDNIANDASDMAIDATTNVFDRDLFIDAAYTMGDAVADLGVTAVHSVVAKRMAKNDDVETIRDSEGNIVMQRYLGRTLVTDDSMPIIDGKILSIMFGRGAFGYGEGSPNMPVEVERKSSAGNGGGQDILHERKTWLLHPAGYEFTSDAVAGQSATLAELSAPANWTRKYDRKNVPIAFLLTTP